MKTLMQFRVSDSYLKQEEKEYIVNTFRAQGIRKWKIIHIETWSISIFFFFARQLDKHRLLLDYFYTCYVKTLFSCTFSRTDPRIRCLFFFFFFFYGENDNLFDFVIFFFLFFFFLGYNIGVLPWLPSRWDYPWYTYYCLFFSGIHEIIYLM